MSSVWIEEQNGVVVDGRWSERNGEEGALTSLFRYFKKCSRIWSNYFLFVLF